LSNPNDCVDCCNTQCYASCPSECGGYWTELSFV
jgi:hypothetical protein